MSDIVVDSCVIAKWFLPESDSVQADAILADATTRGSRLVVVDMALAEVANAIWKYQRRGKITADEARVNLADLRATPLHIEPAAPLLTAALEIAMQYDRTIYDALFVALASGLSLPGVTSDEPLVNAFGAAYPQFVLLRNWP